jgi:hypothetical protein
MNSLSNPEAAAIKTFLQIYPEIIANPNEDCPGDTSQKPIKYLKTNILQNQVYSLTVSIVLLCCPRPSFNQSLAPTTRLPGYL